MRKLLNFNPTINIIILDYIINIWKATGFGKD